MSNLKLCIPDEQENIVNPMHADPTANRAVGALERELKMMRREAERIRALRRSNLLTPEEERRARRRFRGIYRPLLEKALMG